MMRPLTGRLAAQINAEHAAVSNALRAGLAHALKADELLLKAKAAIPYGQFGARIRQNCEFSERTAQAALAPEMGNA